LDYKSNGLLHQVVSPQPVLKVPDFSPLFLYYTKSSESNNRKTEKKLEIPYNRLLPLFHWDKHSVFHIGSLLTYAIVVTIIAVLVTIWIGRASERAKSK